MLYLALVMLLSSFFSRAAPLKSNRFVRRAISVATSNGPIKGMQQNPGSNRYTIPYAQPPLGPLRFQDPQPVVSWSNVFDGSKMRNACAQSGGPVSSISEDCLYLNLWQPATANPESALPVFVWLHGGSRSVLDPGLDGANLAKKGNMLVVTIEYRQGALGSLRKGSSTIIGNQGLKDIMLALKCLQQNAAAFGGNPDQVTLAGQSTGASLIATLLATPTADILFARAILQSAPLNYGDHSISTTEALGNVFMQQLGCTDLACLQRKLVSDILSAENNAINLATDPTNPHFVKGIAQAQAFRPVIDGDLVKGNLMSQKIPLTRTDRAFILSTVHDEAASEITAVSAMLSADGKPGPISPSAYQSVVQSLLTPASRSTAVLASSAYILDPSDPDTVRNVLTRMGTDYVWRCANQQAAVLASQMHVSKGVWLAEFEQGIQYVTNQGIGLPKCKVSHEDDILLVFGNSPGSLSPQQITIQNEVMSRWSAFARFGTPNALNPSYANWRPVSSASQLNMIKFGGGQQSAPGPIGASSLSTFAQAQDPDVCGPNTLWGSKVPFDVTIYDS